MLVHSSPSSYSYAMLLHIEESATRFVGTYSITGTFMPAQLVLSTQRLHLSKRGFLRGTIRKILPWKTG